MAAQDEDTVYTDIAPTPAAAAAAAGGGGRSGPATENDSVLYASVETGGLDNDGAPPEDGDEPDLVASGGSRDYAHTSSFRQTGVEWGSCAHAVARDVDGAALSHMQWRWCMGVPLGDPDENFDDIERYGILSTAGTDKFGNPVFCFKAANMPTDPRCDFNKLLRYMKKVMDQIVESDYSIVYLHHGLNSKNKPKLSWLRKVYQAMDRKYKKNLKALSVLVGGRVNVMVLQNE